MRAVVQRVSKASVAAEGVITGQINKGYLVLLGIGTDDNEKCAEKLAEKIINMRIFADSNGKTNLSIKDVSGDLLVVSQFTLYADSRKGNRPSFTHAAGTEKANSLYEYFVDYCRRKSFKVEAGKFGGDMKVELVNDGPFTVILETNGVKFFL